MISGLENKPKMLNSTNSSFNNKKKYWENLMVWVLLPNLLKIMVIISLEAMTFQKNLKAMWKS